MGYKNLKLSKRPTVRSFWNFVFKRHEIWYKRFTLKQKPPWTRDKILRDNQFCNVYRELDRGTIWAIEHTLKKKNRRQRLFATIAYRCCNRPATFDMLGIPTLKLWEWFWEDMCTLSQEESVFSSAYRCSAFGPTPRMKIYHDTLANASESIQLDGLTTRMRKAGTLEEAHAMLVELWGIGPFIAYEIVNDLMYTDFFPQDFTENDFVIIGPGAAHALKFFWGIIKKKDQLEYMEHLRDSQIQGLGENFPWYHGTEGDISLANIENSLCEFRKWTNAKNGGGHLRRYSPSGTTPQKRPKRSMANLEFLKD